MNVNAKKSDKVLHLTAPWSGFRCVIGAMATCSCTFISIFIMRGETNDRFSGQRSGNALRVAMQELQRKKGITPGRWVYSIHY